MALAALSFPRPGTTSMTRWCDKSSGATWKSRVAQCHAPRERERSIMDGCKAAPLLAFLHGPTPRGAGPLLRVGAAWAQRGNTRPEGRARAVRRATRTQIPRQQLNPWRWAVQGRRAKQGKAFQRLAQAAPEAAPEAVEKEAWFQNFQVRAFHFLPTGAGEATRL